MSNNAKVLSSGAVLAMAAAAYVGDVAPVQAQSGQSDLLHCYDANICKGHNDCATAGHACAGHGECKGQGNFIALPSKACADVGGKVQDEWRGSIAAADLVHCYDVNICKGHNDCKTADHACAGQGECKGHGNFVAAPAKACGDMGGRVGP